MEEKKTLMSFSEFCDRLKKDGAYIGYDGHIYRANGVCLSRIGRNGYYTLRKMYDGHCYYFMEHRVVWYFVHGSIDENKVINHKDFDRTNNRIENLELISQKDNVKYSKEMNRYPDSRGENHWRASLTEKEAQAIKYMKKNGWSQKQLAKLFNAKNENLISRVVTGARYGNVEDASSVISIYPTIVMKTIPHSENSNFSDRLCNIALGISGESGEVVDIIKKFMYQGHELDINELILELGDLLYYMCWMCIELGLDFSEICFANMEKLNKRYPDGFDPERSINRED